MPTVGKVWGLFRSTARYSSHHDVMDILDCGAKVGRIHHLVGGTPLLILRVPTNMHEEAHGSFPAKARFFPSGTTLEVKIAKSDRILAWILTHFCEIGVKMLRNKEYWLIMSKMLKLGNWHWLSNYTMVVSRFGTRRICLLVILLASVQGFWLILTLPIGNTCCVFRSSLNFGGEEALGIFRKEFALHQKNLRDIRKFYATSEGFALHQKILRHIRGVASGYRLRRHVTQDEFWD